MINKTEQLFFEIVKNFKKLVSNLEKIEKFHSGVAKTFKVWDTDSFKSLNKNTVSSTGINACGDITSWSGAIQKKVIPKKQENNKESTIYYLKV